MFKHKCEMCGLEFETNNTRAKYCIYCRDKAQAARNRAYAEKKKSGSAVKIGSEQVCPTPLWYAVHRQGHAPAYPLHETADPSMNALV